MVAQKEPFANLLTQGMVLGQSYRRHDTNKYLRPSELIKTGLELKLQRFRNLYCNHCLNVHISQRLVLFTYYFMIYLIYILRIIILEQGFIDKSSGAAVIVDWEKMSKSKYNGIDPEVRKHFLLFLCYCWHST